jgi:UDP-glucose 4-epimerase
LKAVVFGANGVVGSWTVASLINSGFDVVGVSRTDSRIQFQENSKFRYVKLEPIQWFKILELERPDVVLHCDWSGVGSNYKNSLHQSKNVARWVSLSNSILELDIPKVIYIGSQAEFGNNLKKVNRHTQYSPLTKYGESKVDALTKLEAIYSGTNTQFVWARLFSMYGAIDEGQWLVPSMIRDLIHGNSFNLSSGVQKWNYLHFADVARALSVLAESSYSSSFFNIGSREPVKILDIADLIAKILGRSNMVTVQDSDVNPITEVNVNIDELLKLGWAPEINLEPGLQKTIEWFQGVGQEFSEYGFDSLSARICACRTL